MIFGDNFFFCQVSVLECCKVLVTHSLVKFLVSTSKLHCDVTCSLFVFIDTGSLYVNEGG